LRKVWCLPIFRCWLPTPRGRAHSPPHPTPPHTTPVHSAPLCPTSHLLTGVHPFLYEWFTHGAGNTSVSCLSFAAGWCMANRFLSPRARLSPPLLGLSLPTTSNCPHRIRLLLQNRVRAHRACVSCVLALAPNRQPEAQWVPAGRDHGFCPAPLAHVVRGHGPRVGSRRCTRTSLGVHALTFMPLAT
jgi:hypothetical protein